MIKMVIFNMAGTTIDESNLVYSCMHKAFAKTGYEVDVDVIIEHGAGKDKKRAISDIFYYTTKEIPFEKQVNKIFKEYSKILDKSYKKNKITTFDGVHSILGYLKRRGIKRVFNTGYSYNTAMKILEKVNIRLDDDIDLLVTSDMVKSGRPDPDMILHALEKFGISGDHCIKIGDSQVDITEGTLAGIKYNIGITTGAHTKNMLEIVKPTLIIDNLIELIPIIEHENMAY